ncbi:MAG: protein phosphatase 2C domain-containing protein [Candidatus Magasanikbacteria bacterium]|nr:protein phosphatase 2C domain-containing protein [Candidatus Magasanikbacteria bacterium]
MLKDKWEVASGTIIGKDHIHSQKNNQDAWRVIVGEKALVVLVSDGCSAGMHSEVGANLGAGILAESLNRNLAKMDDFSVSALEAVLERSRQDTLAAIRILANAMGGSFSQTIEDYFLFTALGAIITNQETFLFAVGDGMFFLNGEMIELLPFAGNKPPYLAYALVNTTLGGPDLFRLRIIRSLPTEQLENLIVGTDGMKDLVQAQGLKMSGQTEVVKPVEELWQDDRFFKNPDQLRRYLTQVNRELKIFDQRTGVIKVEPGHLPDDTTLVVVRRKEG